VKPEAEANVESLKPFFKPRAVAVIGASREEGSIGGRLLRSMIEAGFAGAIYPVNPKAAAIQSLKAYASLAGVPGPVDLAVIAVPRAAVLSALQQCAAQGVRAAVVISAGFSETGGDGKELQQELLATARGAGIRMIGPNCMGLLNTDPAVRLNASFSPVFPPAGNLAMSSQSGALGLAILELAAERKLGLSTFVSVGNKADVSSNDLIQYWKEDAATKVILLYLESFGNPRKFVRIARDAGRTKPIIAVKAGRSVSGKRAAGSHTAALAASDVATDALFQQAGVLRAEALDELFDLAAAFSTQPLPRGKRVGIVTNAGGPGILCADACESHGLVVPELGGETRAALRRFLPDAAGVSNPVDMVASAGAASYRLTIETLLASREIDALIVIHIVLDRSGPASVVEAIAAGIEIGRARGDQEIPVLVCWMGGRERITVRAAGSGVPVYAFPEQPARVLAQCVRYAEWRAEPLGEFPVFGDIDVSTARALLDQELSGDGTGWLSASAVASLLDIYGIPHVRGGLATTPQQAADLAAEIGFPVAVKLASSEIVHKTEVDGVHLGLQNGSEVLRAFESIESRLADLGKRQAMQGVVVQQMIEDGVEVMIGVTHDPLFGPLIAFGLGGIHVEILGDVRFRITPLSDKDARVMVRQIRGFRLLQGYRGHAAADVAAIEQMLLRISAMVETFPEIQELDLNPIMARPPGQGCCVLDARIYIKR
jgi:acetyl coenzyme A synthetase (ADP forming)-like protein